MKGIKFVFSALVGISIFLSGATSVFAEAHVSSWYVKRNGNKRPLLSAEQTIINEYNAYYIDNSLNDDSERKVIYLTYDAGYENGNIEKTLDILKEEEVPAAFFLLDNIILKNTALVTRMADEGHLVCNHTKNHKCLCGMTQEQIEKNLKALETLYEEKTGRTMAKYFRFPEGKYNEEALRCVSELGYKTVFWSFAYDDWDNARQLAPEKAIKKILSNTHNGAVILFHPMSDTNVKILPTLIKKWRELGYIFGTLDELTGAQNLKTHC